MRPLAVGFGLLLALAYLVAPARAQVMSSPALRFVFLRTASPVVIDQMTAAGPGDVFGVARVITRACVTFHNTDPRPATAVQFAFVFYDSGGSRAGSQILTRTGTYSTGARIEAVTGERKVRLEDCVKLTPPSDDAIVMAYYVDSVAFADGTSWTASGMTLPDRAVPGTLVPVVPPPAPGAVATATLPALVSGSYPNCAAAEALSPLPSDRSVFVDVKAGPAVGSGLNRIGDVAMCRSSGDIARDAAAMSAVKALPLAIVRQGTFALTLPTIAVTATCDAPARLLERKLITSTNAESAGVMPGLQGTGMAPPGEYIAIAHVAVRADGYPADAQVVRSTHRPEYDEAIKYSALESRYWPAIQNGAPVAGGFDFAMRWTIAPDPAAANRSTVTIAGPVIKPLPPECLAH